MATADLLSAFHAAAIPPEGMVPHSERHPPIQSGDGDRPSFDAFAVDFKSLTKQVVKINLQG